MMFPDLSKAADALNEARDLMKELIQAINTQSLLMQKHHVELLAAIERKENATL